MKNSENGSVIYLCESCGKLWDGYDKIIYNNYIKDRNTNGGMGGYCKQRLG